MDLTNIPPATTGAQQGTFPLRDQSQKGPHVGRHLSRTLKKSNAPAEDRTGDPSIYSLALYHVAIKTGLYRKAVQVYYIPNLYPVTHETRIFIEMDSACRNQQGNSDEVENSARPFLLFFQHCGCIYASHETPDVAFRSATPTS